MRPWWRAPWRRPLRVGIAAVFLPLLLVGLVGCESRAVTDGPRLSFQEREHDFGRTGYNQELEYRFAFRNTGGRPLEISAVVPEPASPGG